MPARIFFTPSGSDEARAPFTFWVLLLAVWAALNTVFLAGDLFTLYVALELLTFAAVPLVCLDGRGETLRAALRYLLFALAGSVLYLVGTALLYGMYGTLDIVLLSQRVGAVPPTLIAAALMTIGLVAKSALFPLHLWLPPAHAGAPAAASAVLSALVVKGSFFIVVRLWFDAMPGVATPAAMQLPAAMGAAAIVVGSIVALRQQRLKLLIAYSTLAQIGYLFLMFPLAFDPVAGRMQSGAALAGGIIQAMSHATAKAAMFLAAGLVYAALGHDRIAGLGGVARALPVTVAAFALGGIALIGLPASGTYLAKTLLLQAAAQTAQPWWDAVIQAGGILTGSYVLLVLAHMVAPGDAQFRCGVRFRAARRSRRFFWRCVRCCSDWCRGSPISPVPRIWRRFRSRSNRFRRCCGRSWAAACWRSCWEIGGFDGRARRGLWSPPFEPPGVWRLPWRRASSEPMPSCDSGRWRAYRSCRSRWFWGQSFSAVRHVHANRT